MRLLTLFPLLLCVSSCSSPAPQPEPQAAVAPKPVDLGHYLPEEGRVKAEIVADHLLGKDFLPGGNLVTYEEAGKRYQIFLFQAKNPDAAGFAVFDLRKALTDGKQVPHFGGCFGMDGETPVFAFPKGRYVAGYVGLPEAEADAKARALAARLR